MANRFFDLWIESSITSLGFFWMAMWAFILGYALSSMVQVFVTRQRMQEQMGSDSLRSVILGTFFGFISSSCSFSALAASKSLFQKGASFIGAIAFLLSSTNLVIELGIVISIFLGWQFVVGEYVGGILLIAISWAMIKLIRPTKLIRSARSHLGDAPVEPDQQKGINSRISSRKEWAKVGKQYIMEWKMVWKDVTVGFTIAGIIAAFVPDSAFSMLFIGLEEPSETYSFFTLLQHVVIGPVAAFATFIGSMGNIPLAALLYGKGISFAGVMAFIFSDLVVFPVLRINAAYYGWRMSMFILFLLLTSLIFTSLGLHYGLAWMDYLPDPSSSTIIDRSFFKMDYTFFLNIGFLLLSGVLVSVALIVGKDINHDREMAPKNKWVERVIKCLAFVSYIWIFIGLILHLFINVL